MSIGSAIRLQELHYLSSYSATSAQSQAQSDARLFWCVFVLGRMFYPQRSGSPVIEHRPTCPRSSPVPPVPLVIVESNETAAGDLASDEDGMEDLGIVSYAFEWVSLWDDLASWLQRLRLGKSETPWVAGSGYMTLNVNMFETEAKLHPQHLMRHNFFLRRTPEELRQRCTYWKPWLLMQIISHSLPAILNHPFIHTVALRRERHARAQSRHFLQQTVDQAIFHSGWVFRLTEAWTNLGMECNDPLVGFLVAAVATIPLLFSYAPDQKLSRIAREDFARSTRFLSSMGLKWPHIARKVIPPIFSDKLKLILTLVLKLETLEALHSTAEIPPHQDSTPIDGGTVVSINTALLWELLDPTFHRDTQSNFASPASTAPSLYDRGADLHMNVTTRFAHPPVGDKDSIVGNSLAMEEQSRSSGLPNIAMSYMEPVSLDDLFPAFPDYGIDWPIDGYIT